MEHQMDQAGRTMIGVGAYSLRGAALLLGIRYHKLRRWAAGYWFSAEDEDRFSEAVIPGEADELDERILSFVELMELYVVNVFRDAGVSMQVIRAARTRAQHIFGTEHPFATEQLQTDGRGIFADLPVIADFSPSRLKLGLSKSQITYRELVEPFFTRNVDFTGGVASTYWPLGRDRPILLDARRAFGQPIVARSGTPTFALYEMRQAGETRERIASWYRVTLHELDAAIDFEQGLRKAA